MSRDAPRQPEGTSSSGIVAASRGELPEESSQQIEPRLVALFLVGCVLFGYPLVGAFSEPSLMAGIPALYLYLVVAWSAFIGALAWLILRRTKPRRRRSAPGEPLA